MLGRSLVEALVQQERMRHDSNRGKEDTNIGTAMGVLKGERTLQAAKSWRQFLNASAVR